MTSIDKAVIARVRKGDRNFEILVDCEKAIEFRKDPSKVDIRDVLAIPEVYKDARKGERAGNLKEVFGTDDPFEVAKKILIEGEVQLTAEYRKKLQEEKLRKIINLITTNAVDARTNKPIPEKRIELALEEAKVKIDPFKSAEEQLKDVVEALRMVIPIKFEQVKIEGRVPVEFGPKVYAQLQRLGEVLKAEWRDDGSLHFIIQVPAGMQSDVLGKISKLTHGSADAKVINNG
ncbi:MAG TPA: ribosome assembly factor SBDS [Candidatus Aenigmarchaeota archaeon]|nr:ribosome assembly factor SBDS [Candidatus Aenigmarchaeota archaeon]